MVVNVTQPVAPTPLALNVSVTAGLGTFTDGLAQTYTSTVAATVSSPGPAVLTIADLTGVGTPGHLYNPANGGFSLVHAIQAQGASSAPNATGFGPAAVSASQLTLLSYSSTVSNDTPTVTLAQTIDANEGLHSGAYSKTLTFTLTTPSP